MSNEQTLRDTFAAAALTGLIERRPWPVDKNESATICYQFADAMLRERAATNHDAAPAAKAEVATGTGHTTREPVAWAAIDGYGRVVFTAPSAAACGGVEPLTPRRIVPLYRDPPCQDFLRKNLTPTLTDAERAAIKSAIGDYEANDMDAGCWQMAATLRSLLARLGGAS